MTTATMTQHGHHGPIVLLVGLVLAVVAAVALPALHETPAMRVGHYEGKRLPQAYRAREIIKNPWNPCTQYECTKSAGSPILKVCKGMDGGKLVHALQWLYYKYGKWNEGTVFIQRNDGKVERYLKNNGCKEVGQ